MTKVKKIEILKEPMEQEEVNEVFVDFLGKLGIDVDKSDTEKIEEEMEKIHQVIQNEQEKENVSK